MIHYIKREGGYWRPLRVKCSETKMFRFCQNIGARHRDLDFIHLCTGWRTANVCAIRFTNGFVWDIKNGLRRR